MKTVSVKITVRELRDLIAHYECAANECERFAAIDASRTMRNRRLGKLSLDRQKYFLDKSAKHQSRATELRKFLPVKIA